MSDIAERLRKHVNDRGGPSIENGAWQMMLDAADEIDALKHDIERHLKIAADLLTPAQDAPQAKECLDLAATFENAKRVADYNPAIRELQSDFTFFDDECKLIAKALRHMAGATNGLATPALTEGMRKTAPWVCCHCDADLSCAACGHEQPNDSAYYAAIEAEAKQCREARDYVLGAIASYDRDQPDNDFQRGHLAALEVVRDEAFTPSSVASTERGSAA